MIYLVIDTSKDCYDAGNQFQAAFSSYELALTYCNRFDDWKAFFLIVPYELDSE